MTLRSLLGRAVQPRRVGFCDNCGQVCDSRCRSASVRDANQAFILRSTTGPR